MASRAPKPERTRQAHQDIIRNIQARVIRICFIHLFIYLFIYPFFFSYVRADLKCSVAYDQSPPIRACAYYCTI